MLDELLELEHQGWTSLCDSAGADFYGRLMTPDGVMVLAHGMVLDRDAVVASLDEAPPWRTYEITDERLIPLGDDHAILVYTGRATRDGDEPPFVALMSSVYTRRDGAWRLALYQQTPVPERSGR
ncbi:nuclear transport factor 2 family protein [Microbacterium jejuense]|uniref:nuclear transport factor 2 family protein n=1 Tax=Microbacterium jejuense TaxID=1263637 RepID=UPI0027E3509A|nr:nuclear transport factor 2 family protein [Microbacterium jejuense]